METAIFNGRNGSGTAPAAKRRFSRLTSIGSFTVTALTNVCIQDDHSGDTFTFVAQTGAYTYTRCRHKFTLTGTGVMRAVNGLITLTDNRPDRRISAMFNLGQLTGRSNFTLMMAPGVYQTITVNQTNPHATCACSG
jgi:hypothetical protein